MDRSRFQLLPTLSPLVARERRLITEALGTLDAWGYVELEIPLLAPETTLAPGLDQATRDELYRAVDRNGQLLVLRGDLTPAVASRLAASVRAQSAPIRVSYAQRVARVQREFAREQVESTHLGIELVGGEPHQADLELLTILVDVLRTVGIDDAEVQLGHVGLAHSVVQAAVTDVGVQRTLLAAIRLRDEDQIATQCAENDVQPGALRSLQALCRYDIDRAVIQAIADDAPTREVQQSATALLRLHDEFVAIAPGHSLHFDLSVIDERGYYTGMHVAVLSRESGTWLGSGGRYDQLYGRFGAPSIAAGFSLRMDRVAKVSNAPVPPRRSSPLTGLDSQQHLQLLREHTAAIGADSQADTARTPDKPKPGFAGRRSTGFASSLVQPPDGTLRIAVPKGRLLKDAVRYLRTKGIIKRDDLDPGRKLVIDIPEARDTIGAELQLLLLKNTDVPTYVEHGIAELGICGSDVLDENAADVDRPLTFPFGGCRVCLAGHDPDVVSFLDSGGTARIATKYTAAAARVFEARGWSADFIELHGSVELGAVLGLADAIVDLVETGNTLRENDLHVLADLATTRVHLAANRALIGRDRAAVAALIRALRAD